MRFSVAAAAVASALFVAGTSAQSSVYPPFNADDVDEGQKVQWCTTQEASCPLICYDQGKLEDVNECDVETATARCVCDDGKEPDLDVYSQTVNYFVCQYQVEQCVNGCNGISLCVSKCREDKPCGARDPPKANTTETAKPDETASQTKSAPTGKFTGGFGTDGKSDEDSSDNKGSAASLGKQYSLGLVILGLGAGFTMFL